LEDFLPVSHARWLADRIPNVVTHFPPDDDHSNVEENNRAAAFAWLKASVDQSPGPGLRDCDYFRSTGPSG